MVERHMLRPFALFLALLLAFMGPQFALARAPAAGDAAVLCIGGGLVQITLDAEGQPTGPGHYCPDCVAFALPEAGGPAPEAQPAQWQVVIWPQAGTGAAAGFDPRINPARAPPAGV